jgi:hypothetical protein
VNGNPWRRLPAGKPFVLPEDEQLIRNFNDRVGRGHDHFLHTDKILPEAFLGARDAPVVFLSNNPGFSEERARAKQDPVFVARMRTNLLHEPLDYPFVFLDPDFGCAGGKKWWERKLKALLGLFGHQVIARDVLNVPYFPYPSRRYGHGRLSLPSQVYGFKLVRDAMKRGAVIVRMRKNEKWLTQVDGLRSYEHLYHVENWQNPTISRRNCNGFDAIVRAIEVAEMKR